ncbi:shikimate 5-dehydrogenase [Tolumonas lignilytica]|uniref:shikimate 5-dehydrogenase n=1 Tax=Tolumonas lignilytica TaxID=1283284 RepID=UPI00046715E3|nr:shikimate 5-dehydrogenase [Tolumonas lignilytica]
MTRHLNKDTTVCMSLAARPSNFGTRFHNFLYDALDLDYLYKAFTTTDLAAAIGGVRALGIRGCAISMPFKEACIPMLDELDASAKAIDSVNTIVNTNGYLKAYNTDYIAIAKLLVEHQVSNRFSFILRGSGGMAKAVACALKDAGFTQGHIVARNENAGKHLAELYGFEWHPDLNGLQADVIINVTPIGMAGSVDAETLSFSEETIQAAQVVFDVVALPAETPLIRYAKSQGKKVITGAEVFAIQAVEQFVLYTGIRPSDELFQLAAKYARG